MDSLWGSCSGSSYQRHPSIRQTDVEAEVCKQHETPSNGL